MNRRVAGLIGVMLVAALCGCASHPPARGNRPSLADFRIVYSPNGEPLTGGPLGRPACADAVAGWFARTDLNHDGFLDHDEFMADAQAQFTRMDLDHSGVLTTAKLAVYRQPYQDVPPPSLQNSHSPRGDQAGEDQGRPPRLQDQEDPVMVADKTLSFKVTQGEYMAHVEEMFVRLDPTHQGRVALATVQSWSCANQQGQARR